MPIKQLAGPAAVAPEVTQALEEMDRLIADVETAAQDWGVRPDHLEGRFVAALVACMRHHGRLILGALTDIGVSARLGREAAAMELARLNKEAEAAQLADAHGNRYCSVNTLLGGR